MKLVSLDIDELGEYVYNAFVEDYELVKFYDKNVNIITTEDCINNICFKIETSYPESNFFGIEIDDEKVGYFVCTEELLISFGLAVRYRNRKNLKDFWKFIKTNLSDNFQCVLYAYNKRGIQFLQKGGMKILFENITILTNN